MVLPGMQTASNVQFRFRFLADGVTYDGHSIDDFSITNTVGISETGKNNLHIYPNPVTDHLYISFPESNNSTVIIRLLTMSGTELLSHPVQSLSTIQFDVKSIDTGIYILEIFSGYKSYYARVVKN